MRLPRKTRQGVRRRRRQRPGGARGGTLSAAGPPLFPWDEKKGDACGQPRSRWVSWDQPVPGTRLGRAGSVCVGELDFPSALQQQSRLGTGPAPVWSLQAFVGTGQQRDRLQDWEHLPSRLTGLSLGRDGAVIPPPSQAWAEPSRALEGPWSSSGLIPGVGPRWDNPKTSHRGCGGVLGFPGAAGGSGGSNEANPCRGGGSDGLRS